MTHASRRRFRSPTPGLPSALRGEGTDLLHRLAQLFRDPPPPEPTDARLREDTGLPADDRPMIEVDAVTMARLRGLW